MVSLEARSSNGDPAGFRPPLANGLAGGSVRSSLDEGARSFGRRSGTSPAPSPQGADAQTARPSLYPAGLVGCSRRHRGDRHHPQLRPGGRHQNSAVDDAPPGNIDDAPGFFHDVIADNIVIFDLLDIDTDHDHDNSPDADHDNSPDADHDNGPDAGHGAGQ
jgi:hypothetical protein